ncbi:U2 snRNP AUXILIARY FACTOR SMALL SUBUNIT (SPLICING FACTOR U2AF) [Encephalitozoon cuniculi GB-M1]|uniref:U2 snRNP AUXILIARY FACTOR SMALL SUBUNIT (SPLICING FACTOR U2AF) n=1 Tax=Encephalitozoon cuniculi (strain GB-M1) TaxID=284813 RepID=Q8SQL5_ENCCU|nr:uncharacterized protein ECU09_1420 [Encephalitozoon cuniculi GB-M1]CAD27114.1 U2 snRNP AUXILIARY FACTOR SMALL SUBUNIT (SPLICING FACTOR U2AF) [Encephalitozoon cuniculi GB-M1]
MVEGREACLFYSKTNGCRYGHECTKVHRIPTRSRVVVVKAMYLYPKNDPESTLGEESVQIHLDLFYEDWFTELSVKYGAIRKLVIASNSCIQILGNIYIEFHEEEAAMRCAEEIGRRYYGGKRIVAELGNCYRTDDGTCTEHERGLCGKGEKCGFIHAARVSRSLVEELLASQALLYPRTSDANRIGPGPKDTIPRGKCPGRSLGDGTHDGNYRTDRRRLNDQESWTKRPRGVWNGGQRRYVRDGGNGSWYRRD